MTPPGTPGTGQRLLAGLIGALTVTLLNEGVRQVLPHAPRIDVIGERGLTRVLRAVGSIPPRGAALYWSTLAADLVSNALFYSVIGLGDPAHVGRRGAALGITAGLGAALLPPRLGLGHQPGERWPVTPVLTATWYLAGGLATALTLSSMQRWNRRQAPARFRQRLDTDPRQGWPGVHTLHL